MSFFRARSLAAHFAERIDASKIADERCAPYSGKAGHWESQLQPGASAVVSLRITFRTVTDNAVVQRIAAVDYGEARERIIAFWRKATEPAAKIQVPDKLLNRFSRSVLQHILLSVERDVSTGLYMDPCGTYDYSHHRRIVPYSQATAG